MTAQDLDAINAMTPERATNDLIAYIEDVVMKQGSKLTIGEREDIGTKVHFWWHAARIQGGNAAFDKIKQHIGEFV